MEENTETMEEAAKNPNEISASAPKVGKKAAVDYPLGESLEEACELFGEDVVFGLYKGQATVRIQAGLRTCMEKGVDPVAWAANYKIGLKAPSIAADPNVAADIAISQMDEDAKRELLERMKADLGMD